MATGTLKVWRLAAGLAILTLGGCAPGATSSGAALPVQSAAHSSTAPDGSRSGGASFSGSVWITDAGANQVLRCTSATKCTALGPSWGEPQGIAGDHKGRVFVADTANSRIVGLDKQGVTLTVLSDPGEYPDSLTVAPDDTIAAVSFCDSQGCGAGNTVLYTPGATSPTSTISGPILIYAAAFDRQGNLWNVGKTASGVFHFGEVPAGRSTNIDSGVTVPGNPGNIAVAKANGALAVIDQSSGSIGQYSLPSLKLTRTIQLDGTSDPVGFAFAKGDGDIWTADAGLAMVDEFAFPAGGSAIASIAGLIEPTGVVAMPPGEY
jgi:DNA-binding beta-propeller fold protein YncE